MTKQDLKKFQLQTLICFGVFALLFIILVIVAARGSAPYSPIAFRLGNFSIRWYALFILTGIAFAFVLGLIEFKRFGIDTDILWTGIIIFVPLAILGAHIWYVIFNPGSAFLGIGGGFSGLAIHGGILVTFIGTIFFCKWKKLNYWWFLDVVAPGFLIGQMFGRWGNFFNRELFGPAIQSEWIINILPGFIRDNMFINGAYRHPTFLYESILNFIGLVFLLIIRRKKVLKVGDMLAFYLVWYGLVRIPIEILRLSSGVRDSLGFGGGLIGIDQWYLSVSLWTSIGLILAGVIIFVVKRILQPDLPYYAQDRQKAILFDLDGTLLDTKPLIIKTFVQTFKDLMSNVKLSQAELDSFFGPTLKESFSKYTKDEKMINKLIEHYRTLMRKNHQEGVKPFDACQKTLEELKKRGYKIGIVSSKIEELVRLGLKQNDLEKYIDVFVCYDSVTNHKPHPEGILLAVNKLEATPEHTMYVGDHPSDILAAKAANVKSVGVYYSTHADELLMQNPDYMIDKLERILDVC